MVGPLHSASDADLSERLPILEGRFAGEMVLFRVLDLKQPGVVGSFNLWRDGFKWGRRYPGPDGDVIVCNIAGSVIRVAPAPPWAEVQTPQ